LNVALFGLCTFLLPRTPDNISFLLRRLEVLSHHFFLTQLLHNLSKRWYGLVAHAICILPLGRHLRRHRVQGGGQGGQQAWGYSGGGYSGAPPPDKTAAAAPYSSNRDASGTVAPGNAGGYGYAGGYGSYGGQESSYGGAAAGVPQGSLAAGSYDASAYPGAYSSGAGWSGGAYGGSAGAPGSAVGPTQSPSRYSGPPGAGGMPPRPMARSSPQPAAAGRYQPY
jgi:hypothetical protein